MTARYPHGRVPLLSVVVPVHDVEPFLLQCLDSVLSEAGDDVQVVAVDDVSPDGCPALLDAYAAADDRLTVVRLDTNVGLGRARNAGLDRATGEYVWFVDSDDWLPPGSIPAVLAALRTQRPDVLLIDHVRVHDPDGRIEPDPSSAVLRGPAVPGPLADNPDLIRLQHAAWNKVVRVELLRRHGLRFYPGWYEDCAFSHPLLVAADTVAVLDRVCYHYRQRVSGGITRTLSERHFDVFDQYERMFADLDRLGDRAAPVRATVFRMMIDHYLVIAGNTQRLADGRRAAFFHRAARHYRRFKPAGGYPAPGGAAVLKHRMLAADAYWAWAALRRAYRLAGSLRRPATVPAVPVPVVPAQRSAGPVPPAAPVVPVQRRRSINS